MLLISPLARRYTLQEDVSDRDRAQLGALVVGVTTAFFAGSTPIGLCQFYGRELEWLCEDRSEFSPELEVVIPEDFPNI